LGGFNTGLKEVVAALHLWERAGCECRTGNRRPTCSSSTLFRPIMYTRDSMIWGTS
jgi:hypothetical protein